MGGRKVIVEHHDSGARFKNKTIYTVTLSMIFEADSPGDAVLQMAAYAETNAYQAGYRVVSEEGHFQFIDAEDDLGEIE